MGYGITWFYISFGIAACLFLLSSYGIRGNAGALVGTFLFAFSLFGVQYIQPDYVLKQKWGEKR